MTSDLHPEQSVEPPELANLNDWRVVYSEVGERSVEFFKAPTLAARLRAWKADLEMGERAAPRMAPNRRFRRQLEQFEGELPSSG